MDIYMKDKRYTDPERNPSPGVVRSDGEAVEPGQPRQHVQHLGPDRPRDVGEVENPQLGPGQHVGKTAHRLHHGSVVAAVGARLPLGSHLRQGSTSSSQ